MIGSGIPISQSNTPFPNDMAASDSMLTGQATHSGSIGSIARYNREAIANPLTAHHREPTGRCCRTMVRKEF